MPLPRDSELCASGAEARQRRLASQAEQVRAERLPVKAPRSDARSVHPARPSHSRRAAAHRSSQIKLLLDFAESCTQYGPKEEAPVQLQGAGLRHHWSAAHALTRGCAQRLAVGACRLAQLALRCAGTLIDFEAGVVAFLRQRVEAAGQQCSDNELLESYARTEKVQQVPPAAALALQAGAPLVWLRQGSTRATAAPGWVWHNRFTLHLPNKAPARQGEHLHPGTHTRTDNKLSLAWPAICAELGMPEPAARTLIVWHRPSDTRACLAQDLHPQKNTMDIFSLAWPAMCAELGMPESAAPTEEYKASVLDWQPFSDSVAALAYLKQHYVMFPITTGILPDTCSVPAHMPRIGGVRSCVSVQAGCSAAGSAQAATGPASPTGAQLLVPRRQRPGNGALCGEAGAALPPHLPCRQGPPPPGCTAPCCVLTAQPLSLSLPLFETRKGLL